ncbi:hypothetical protein BLOT_011759 [Blomia tropicalis]|nr:hypothetical protein BLOT_011759 [Blomia tropicalis]
METFVLHGIINSVCHHIVLPYIIGTCWPKTIFANENGFPWILSLTEPILDLILLAKAPGVRDFIINALSYHVWIEVYEQ